MNIKIQDKQIEIKTIPIIKYPQILGKIKTLPKYFNEMSGKKNDEIFLMAPQIITDCLPDVLAIFSEATGIDEDVLSTYGLADLIDIFIAVWKQNRFSDSIANIKNEFAQRGQGPVITTPQVIPN